MRRSLPNALTSNVCLTAAEEAASNELNEAELLGELEESPALSEISKDDVDDGKPDEDESEEKKIDEVAEAPSSPAAKAVKPAQKRKSPPAKAAAVAPKDPKAAKTGEGDKEVAAKPAPVSDGAEAGKVPVSKMTEEEVRAELFELFEHLKVSRSNKSPLFSYSGSRRERRGSG